MKGQLTKHLMAWWIRTFCDTCDYYPAYGDPKPHLFMIYMTLTTQPIQYVHVGKNKLWIKKLKGETLTK